MAKLLKTIVFTCVIPLISFANPGFFKKDWKARPIPQLPIPISQNSINSIASQNFVIDFKDSVASVLPNVFGNNSNFYLYKFTETPAALIHLRATGVKNLRLPGGNVSNNWLWNDSIHWNLYENYQNKISSGPTSPYNLNSTKQIALADSIGAMPQPCVNIALARYIQGKDSVQKAASYAASWVRKLNIEQKRNVKYWEVGNENYGSWAKGYVVNGDTITGTMYGQMFNVFADSMKAVDPTIKIGAVVFEGETNPWTGAWNQEVLPLVQNNADYLVVHQYFTYEKNMDDVTIDQMIDALPKIAETKELLENHVKTYTTKAKDYFPIAMTEFNVSAGTKNSTQISAVFNAMALGEYVRSGYGLVNIWDVANNFNDGNDHGMFTRNDPDRNNYDPNPSFYTYFMTNRVFGDKMVKVTPEVADKLRVYPTTFSNGEAGILVVNSGSSAKTISLTLNDFEHNGSYLSYHLSASGPTSREVKLNGISESAVSGPLNYQSIAPFKTAFNDKPILTIEPYSVNTYFFNKKADIVNNNVLTSMSTQELIKLDRAQIFDLKGNKMSISQLEKNQSSLRIIRFENGKSQIVIQR